MKRFAIIVAGGSGERMQSDVPKQFLSLSGKPVLMHTLERFREFDPAIELILVLPSAHIPYWKKLCEQHQFTLDHRITEGGKTRFHSVKNGLELLGSTGIVGVHDGVRPLVSLNTLHQAYSTALSHGNAVPVIPIRESMRAQEEHRSNAVDRDNFRLVQTPQCFSVEELKEAFRQDFRPSFTDEASVVEAAGGIIHLVSGNRENIKITDPVDIKIAEALMERKRE